jgi:ABC-type nitrate/sulfonate/bicarbonate transport system substrate-binding protein
MTRGNMVRAVTALLGAGLGVAAAGSPSPGATPDPVNIALNHDAFNLPIFVAIDRDYFAQQNLDVRVQKISGSTITQLPSLARGSIDIAPIGLGPGFFNQYTGGFDVKLIASMTETHAGWNDATWVMVRQDLWDAGAVRKLSDLKGKTIDGFVPGAPPNMLMRETLTKAGLTTADVTFSERLRATADAVAAYTNKAVDVSPAFEPMATELQRQHLAHKWISTHDIMPDYQQLYLAASAAFVQTHREVIARFLVAYLEGARDIDSAHGKWTPSLVSTLAKWSEQPEADVLQVPSPAYAGEYGRINLSSVEMQQAFWVSQGLVKAPVAIPSIVDSSMLDAAHRQLKIR